LNYLFTDLSKAPFTDAEDRQLGLLVQQKGNKWATIKTFMPARSENSLKNRFNSKAFKNKMAEKKEIEDEDE